MSNTHKAINDACKAKSKRRAAEAELCKKWSAMYKAAAEIRSAAREIPRVMGDIGPATVAVPISARNRCIGTAALHKSIVHAHRNPKERDESGTAIRLESVSRKVSAELTPYPPDAKTLECCDVSPLSVAPTRRRSLDWRESFAAENGRQGELPLRAAASHDISVCRTPRRASNGSRLGLIPWRFPPLAPKLRANLEKLQAILRKLHNVDTRRELP